MQEQNGHRPAIVESEQLMPSALNAATHLATVESHGSERAWLRQCVIHVRIRHFYATLEELGDPALRGQPFVVGTGAGRPNEPGRVIDVSPAAQRLGVSPGMPLRRAYRLAPRARFLPASYERYQPMLQQVREIYRVYSRIVESLPLADAYIDLRGCELPFDTPVDPGEHLCAELTRLGLVPLLGIANGKTIAELAALLSRKDGRRGVLYIPPGRESSFVQTLPLSLLLQVRSTGVHAVLPEPDEYDASSEVEGQNEAVDALAVAEALAHLKDFGVTTFAQVSLLQEEGLGRRLGQLGVWIYRLARGEDMSLVVPDAPPLSQNARVRFPHAADPDEVCEALCRLADHLSERLREQHLKGHVLALLLWSSRTQQRETRKLLLDDEGDELAISAAEGALGGQLALPRHTDEADAIAHHLLMLFAHYHQAGFHYLQVQVRIGDLLSGAPVAYVPPTRPHGKLTRKL